MAATTGLSYATSDWTQTLDLTTAALVGSVSATSYVLYTQVGLGQAGIIPLIRGVLAPRVALSPADKVAAWRAYLDVAKVSRSPPPCTAVANPQHTEASRDN